MSNLNNAGGVALGDIGDSGDRGAKDKGLPPALTLAGGVIASKLAAALEECVGEGLGDLRFD